MRSKRTRRSNEHPGALTVPAILLSLTTLLIIALPAPIGQAGEPDPPPNIVLLVLDTLRADHLGCYGSDKGLSPFIDFLAGGGLRFEKVISQSSWTKTSMASMLTGRNPASHSILVRADKLTEAATLTAERLHDRGYHCLGIQTNPWLTEEYGFHQGFDEYHYLKPKDEGAGSKTAYVPADQVVRFAVNHAARNSRRPLFLYVHFMDPHAPYDPPAAVRPAPPTSEQALYEGEIRFLDQQLKELYRKLGELGMHQNTLFVLVSDHGEEFGEHGGTGHGQTLYGEVLQVPLILHGDPLDQFMDRGGETVSKMVRLIDVTPTLIDIAGAEPLEDLSDGRSVLPMINSWWPSDRPAFSQLGLNFDPKQQDDYFENYALTGPKGKIIINAKTGSEEYFHIGTDPREQTNLVEKPPRAARKLKRSLADYMARALRHRSADETPATDPEQENLDQLRALGYITDDDRP
jgi:arylsulfatase A-like enzyme